MHHREAALRCAVKSHRAAALVGVSMAALAVASTAAAQQAPSDAPRIEEIVVTGSRITRDGYRAPTPVTVVTSEQLTAGSPSNIPDGLNQLPQFMGSRNESGNARGMTLGGGAASGNYLNLRNIGLNRVLVMLDGRRVPPTTFQGIVDTNTLPQALIQRVDVVTAGASAAYGADAVSGVVNFILDKKYKGLKGTVQGGTSEYGDNDSFKVSVAGGRGFADDRGHIVASFEHYENSGIPRKDSRPWYTPLYFVSGVGTATDPYVQVSNARNVTASYGGLITRVSGPSGVLATNPLLNQQFLPGGVQAPFVFGAPTGTASARIGGDGVIGTGFASGSAKIRTDQAFIHARYDFTPNVTGFVQATWAEAYNSFITVPDYRFGAFSGFEIFSGNAFLPASTQATLTSTGATSFQLSRYGTDLGARESENLTVAGNITAGFEGNVGDWKWSAAYTHGEARERAGTPQSINDRFFAAIDAVRNPAGQIVCRVTLTNPGRFPGCVPLNVFGEGAPSAAAIEYVTAVSQYQSVNKLDEFTANISGEPFSIWAGPISMEVGVNYRKQSMVQGSNSDPSIPTDFTGLRGPTATTPRYLFLNVGVAQGSYDSKEAYGETVIPILKDAPFARSLDLNAALRYTDYSTSGGVYTWKVGATWKPVDDLTLRTTRSRDIRAPTLYDLFLGTQLTQGIFTDVGHTNITSGVNQYSSGNPNLDPEKGDTWSAGVVYQASWLPGLSASIDFYDIKISDAIATITAAQAHSACERSGGTDPVCAFILRPLGFSDRSAANFPSEIRLAPINLAKIDVRGLDFEASYTRDLSELSKSLTGALNVRVLASYIDKFNTFNGLGGAPFETAGVDGTPRLRGTASANYITGPLNLFVQARYVSGVKRDTPQNTNLVYADNTVPSVTYVDVSASYDLILAGHKTTPFINIKNLLGKDPPILASTFQVGHIFPTNTAIYDVIGRTYTVGLRLAF